MGNTINYVSIDRVFAKLGRDLKGTELNEGDVIEWIGEALDHLKVPQVLEEKVLFLKVQDYHAEMPSNLHMITQIAKKNDYPSFYQEATCNTCHKPLEKNVGCGCGAEEVLEPTPFSTVCPPDLKNFSGMPDEYVEAIINSEEVIDEGCHEITPIDLDWTYTIWTSSNFYRNSFSPVRLSTGTFFNSLVCKEKDDTLYNTCDYEYNIVGTIEKKLRFNFIEGEIAISYLRNTLDKETGYPLIPDNISYVTAVSFYVKWQIASMNAWSGREGWEGKADKAEAKWIKYARQAKNFMKMPKTIDEHQNLLEQSHYLIPNHKKYYNYFGNLGKHEMRRFQTYDKFQNLL